MKRQILMLLLAVFTITSSFVNAQTPYDNYAPEQSEKEMLQLPETQFQVKNRDLRDSVQYAVFDENNMLLTLFRNDKSIIEMIKIKPLNSKFSTIDRFAEKFPWQSPYCFAANNPIRNIDVNGDSAAVLNIDKGQHVAMLIQNDKGKWQYYSVNGDNVYIPGTDIFMGGRKSDDIAVGLFDSPQQFLNSKYNHEGNEDDKSINAYGFTQAFVLPTTSEQDNAIRKTFTDISQNEEYRLNPFTPNHCGTTVQRSLNSANVRTTVDTYIPVGMYGTSGMTIKTNPYLPSNAFNAIMKNNPNGQLIRRK